MTRSAIESPSILFGVSVAAPSISACAIAPRTTEGQADVERAALAHGRGVLYEHGSVVGFRDISQSSLGALVGGRGCVEIICFQTPQAVARFKRGVHTLNAQANAVARSGQ